MGRGSGTQNHCGNVTYRKLVYLNKVSTPACCLSNISIHLILTRIHLILTRLFLLEQELYVTSSKHEKLKISKAIVAAVRQFGGRFIEVDETRGNAYFEIGDERSWKKTSQALREGQAEIRAQLAAEDASGRQFEYQQVISEQRFFAYACKILESLYNGDSGISACGPGCPHAKRRYTLNQLGAHPMQIYYAMQSLSPQIPLPPPQEVMSQQQLPQDSNLQYNQQYRTVSSSDETSYFQSSSSAAANPETVDLYEPLPFTSPAFMLNRFDANMMQQGCAAEEMPTSEFLPSTAVPAAVCAYNTNTSSGASGLQRLSETSMDGVISLRKIFSDDIAMTSEEGKVLMDLLDHEVEEIIRRKSYGLIQIDTTQAFEDLVFNDDVDDVPLQQLNVDDPNDDLRKNSSSTTTGKSSSSRISGLSLKDDLSLMNMSVLSLDDHPKEEYAAQGEISMRSSLRSDAPAQIEVLKRDSRVSFNTVNISLMSLDNNSFSQLVSSLTEEGNNNNNNDRKEMGKSGDSYDSPAHAISRKIGFPMRRTFIRKIGADGNANESGQTTGVHSNSTISDTSVLKNVVDLTSSEDPMGISSMQSLNSTQVDTLLNNIDGALQG